jgi:guanylate kinase
MPTLFFSVSVSGTNAYHFVSFAEFQSLVVQNAFVEHTIFSGNHYGTSRQAILDQQGKGKILILDVDMNGVKNIRDMTEDFAVRCAFIAPPSLQVFESRLRSRGTESDESIRKRLAQAGLEMDFANTRGPEDVLITNDDLEYAYRKFEQWALRGPVASV